MGTVGIGFVVLVGVLVVAFMVNPQAVKNLFGAGRAQVGKVGRAALDADPLAMAQQEANDAAAKIKPLIDAQKKAEATLDMLHTQVNDDLKEKTRLESRIQTALGKGDTSNAQRHALSLAEVEKRLVTNQGQMQTQEASVTSIAQMVDTTARRLKEIEQRIRDKGQALEQSQAIKDAEAAFSGLTGGDIFGGINTAMSKLDQKIAENRASAKVDQQRCADTLADIEEEKADRAAEADAILARFKQPEQTPAS